MLTSDNISELAGALAKAQAELKNPNKASENPHFRSRYADLATGLNAIRPVLSKHNLAVVQMTRVDGDAMMLDTRLVHASGQWVQGSYYVCKFPTKHQEAGSALSYSRRYSLFAMIGIAGEDEDDDGNEASQSPTPAPARKPPPPKPASNTMAPEDSQTTRDVMLKSLDFCESAESLKEWARSNKATKDRLQSADQNLVAEAYRAKLATLTQE
jgi:hypothetical protein